MSRVWRTLVYTLIAVGWSIIAVRIIGDMKDADVFLAVAAGGACIICAARRILDILELWDFEP